jgi:hypothetical protein
VLGVEMSGHAGGPPFGKAGSEVGQGRRELEGVGADVEQGGAVGVADVAGGQSGDAGDRLGVEQYQQASEAVADGCGGFVVQECAGQVPAVLVVGEVQVLAGLVFRQLDAGDKP